jgi:hypothetical protein
MGVRPQIKVFGEVLHVSGSIPGIGVDQDVNSTLILHNFTDAEIPYCRA